MALVVGTNCGFCIASPEGDPLGTGSPLNNGDALASRHTSPVGNNVITELGFWQGGSDANQSVHYNMGIYNTIEGEPGNLIVPQCTGNMTTALTAEWCRYTGLNIPISPETVYWIGLSIGISTFDANWVDITWDDSALYRFEDIEDYTLSDPFNVDGGPTMLVGVYAKYEAVEGIPMRLVEHSLDGNTLGGSCGRMTE
jgi:hypothetical protein